MGVIRVAVVPAHEDGGRKTAWQVLTGNAHVAVVIRAGGEEYLMVVAQHFVQGQIPAKGHVAKEAETRPPGGALINLDYRLDLRMIGSHAATHQTVRGGQAIEQIHFDLDVFLLEQRLYGIKAGGSAADYRHPQGMRAAADLLRQFDPPNGNAVPAAS